MKLKKITFLILLIFLVGAFLRFFKIQENLLFTAEQGRDYLVIKSAILSRQIPLLGPPGLHQFYQGPLYYWLMAALMTLFGFHPVIGAYLGIIAGSFVVLLNFWVIEKIFNQKVALFSSLLIAVSPLWIEYSREARYFFLVVIPFYFLTWFLYELWQGKKRFLFWTGLAFGVMFNFHLSPIYFMPIISIILWIKRKKMTRKSFFLGILGFTLPNLPLIIHDLTHGLVMTTRFIVWVPYRVVGFLGFYPKNNLTPAVLKENLIAFYNFFSQSFVYGQRELGVLFAAVTIIFVVLNIKKSFVFKKKEDFGWFFVFWALSLGLLTLFIHGLPPRHYFVPLLPFPIIIFSVFLERLWKGQIMKVLILGFLLVVTLSNLRFFLASPIFYAPSRDFILSLNFQERVMRVIIENARGEKFNLRRVGEFDYYPGEHAQNYQYLAWWLGNEPSEEEVNLRYTIYEDTTKIPEDVGGAEEEFQVGNLVILKEIK